MFVCFFFGIGVSLNLQSLAPAKKKDIVFFKVNKWQCICQQDSGGQVRSKKTNFIGHSAPQIIRTRWQQKNTFKDCYVDTGCWTCCWLARWEEWYFVVIHLISSIGDWKMIISNESQLELGHFHSQSRERTVNLFRYVTAWWKKP